VGDTVSLDVLFFGGMMAGKVVGRWCVLVVRGLRRRESGDSRIGFYAGDGVLDGGDGASI
jgi:hypothetical protein